MGSVRPTIVAIEGLIGAGKSTLVSYLQEQLPDALFITEPVDLFTKYKIFNPLALMSSNTFAAQYHIIKSLIYHYKGYISKIQNHKLIITERYIDSPLVFIDALHYHDCISDFEKTLLADLFYDEKQKIIFPEISGIFYLPVPPNICHERVKKRNRNEEENFVSVDYLQNLKKAYLKRFDICQKPVWFAKHDTDELNEMFQELKQFLKDVR